MTYQIHITKTAERDLVGAADNIEFTIKNPSAADNLLDKAEEKISELSSFLFFPKLGVSFLEVHAVVDDPVLSAWGIRFTVINNYLAFFTILGDTVYVIRFLYGKRDWISILKQDFSLE